jgi:PIN domain nuclease of toxin-antitoxin system
MLRAVADTHTIIWYLFADKRLSPTAQATFESAARDGDQIAFSAITLVEIVYLSEKGRIATTTFDRLTNALEKENTMLVEISFNRYIAQTLSSVQRDQVPDLPDRIIVATALYLSLPLISRDRKIRPAEVETIW